MTSRRDGLNRTGLDCDLQTVWTDQSQRTWCRMWAWLRCDVKNNMAVPPEVSVAAVASALKTCLSALH